MKLALRSPAKAALALAMSLTCAPAQNSTAGTAAAGGSTTGSSTTGTGSTTTSPGTATTPQPASSISGPAGPRPTFLSGTLMMDDGSPLPGSVNIQSICGALRRTMGHSDPYGAFIFQWSTTISDVGDASQGGRIQVGGGSGTLSGSSLTGSRNGSRGVDPLSNCELTADYAGYSSSKVSLYNRAGQESYDVGAIVLHRIASGEGHTVSVLALRAPKNARKSFEKGISQSAANKPADALLSFETAVGIYPEYPDAWLGMGKIQWQLARKDEARASFQRSMDLDNSLVGPWQELGYLACDDAKWEDAIRYLDQAVKLDPMDSPAAWYFSALANYNLGRYDRAERNVRAELKLDNGRNVPGDYLLALVLIARKDLQGGAAALRSYIASSPKSADLEIAKKQLSKLENQLSH